MAILRGVLSLLVLALLAACGESVLSMDDATAAGFRPTQEKIYGMVGAIDGAGGPWREGEHIEIYVYDRKSAISDQTRRFFPGLSYTTTREHQNLVIVCRTMATCDSVVAALR